MTYGFWFFVGFFILLGDGGVECGLVRGCEKCIPCVAYNFFPSFSVCLWFALIFQAGQPFILLFVSILSCILLAKRKAVKKTLPYIEVQVTGWWVLLIQDPCMKIMNTANSIWREVNILVCMRCMPFMSNFRAELLIWKLCKHNV